jgi:hypothetical protein
MNDRAFRLDFFIAIAAVLFSGIAAAAAGYQTWIISQQYGVSVWPYLTIATTNNRNSRKISFVNEGLGPALVHSAQLYVDGKASASWNEYEHVLKRDPLAKRKLKGSAFTFADSTVDASTILRPGDTETISEVTLAKGVPRELLQRHPLAIDVCYCSLNNSCWKLHLTPGVISGNYPQPTNICPIGATINSYFE